MSDTIYYVGGSGFQPRIKLVINEDPPPCLWCGTKVHSPSMNGPLMCANCDMGLNRDGSKKSTKDFDRSAVHYKAMIEKYSVKS